MLVAGSEHIVQSEESTLTFPGGHFPPGATAEASVGPSGIL